MSSQKKKSSKVNKKEKQTFLTGFNIDKAIPQKFQTPVYLVLILLLFLIFFSPLYFGGKTFQSGDIITSKSATTYLETDREGYTLWNPYIFGGMPAYAIAAGYKWFNMIWVGVNTLRSVFSTPFAVDYAKWTFYLIALAYTMFIFFRTRTEHKLVSLMASLAVSFSTGIMVFLYIGHVTKLTSLWVFPVLLLMLLNFQKRIKLIDFILLIIFLNIMFLGWHVQIIFYIFFAVFIYIIYFFLRSIRLKDKFLTKQILKSAIVFIIAVAIALLIQLDNFTQIYEYTPFSTRGTESIIEKATGKTEQIESDFYEYATNWSFSPGEVLTFIIPSYYGFGKSTYQGPLSQNQPVEANTYFGQMPFVDVAMYMGVVVFFLALFSMVVNWKDPLVRFLTILTVIALLISFGRTFSVIYDLMFYYFPFFDKFRVPSMILVLVQLCVPILAGLGLIKIISLKPASRGEKEPNLKVEKILRNTAIVFGLLFAIVLLIASPIKDWFIQRIVDSGQRGTQLQPLYEYMSEMFINDARLAFLFSGLTFGLAYAYLKSKLSADLLVVTIIFMIVIDLFRINLRGETYVENERIEALFEKPDYLRAIDQLNDKSIYRVLNLKQDGSIGSLYQNSNFLAYFLHYDIYGYSGIKPRSIQDYYDVLGSPANPTFWRMLNVKYIVFDKNVNYPGLQLIYSNEKTFLYVNQNALPRAYFVNRVEVQPALQILNLVKNNQFDPLEVAFVEEDIEDIESPDSTTSVNISVFKDEQVIFDVNASGNNFLFIGDTYMTGETDYKLFQVRTGWKVFIDGNETKIYRANHGFRGIVVSAGNHKVEIIYAPESFEISKYVALSISSLVLLGLIAAVFIEYRKKKKSSVIQSVI
ncbi:MAG TPA: YfhO family protein [Ignavibacteriaceae bacterium]|nr:YfhO family protein [Ignavibacteriaceae bacterium]